MEQSLLANIQEFIAQVYPFNKLPKPLQRTISEAVQIGYFARGDAIANQGESQCLFVVRVGAVEQRKTSGQLRARLGPGDLFGFSWLSDSDELDYTATAIENALLYMVPVALLRDTVSDYEEFSSIFATQARVRLQSALKFSYNPDADGLLMQPVMQVANSNVVQLKSTASIREAALAMHHQHRSSAVIMEHGQLIGIITDRDMTKRVVATGCDVEQPVTTIMTRNPHSVAADDLVLRAVSVMMEHNVRSLPVLAQQQVVGILSATDLVQRNSMQAVYLNHEILNRQSVDELKQLLPQRQAILEALIEGGAKPKNVGQVMSMIADTLMRRLIQLAELKLGAAPCEYSWLAAGSLARHEVQTLSDQDNALILADSVTEAQLEYFRQMAEFVCAALAELGYARCPNQNMATNPVWCQPLGNWLAYYQAWLTEPSPQQLEQVAVFMDIRHIAGSESLFTQVEQRLQSLARRNQPLLANLVTNSTKVSPPLGVFRSFVLAKDGEHRNTLNIKHRAVDLVVELGRVYGLVEAAQTTSTESRLELAAEAGLLSKSKLDDLLGAYQFVCSLRLKQQWEAMKQGRQPSNNIAPDNLDHLERNHLKDAFAIIADAQDAADLRFASRGGYR